MDIKFVTCAVTIDIVVRVNNNGYVSDVTIIDVTNNDIE